MNKNLRVALNIIAAIFAVGMWYAIPESTFLTIATLVSVVISLGAAAAISRD